MLLSSSSITLTGPSSGGPDSVRRHLNNTIARVLTSFAPFPTFAATLQIPSPDRPICSYLCFNTKAFPRKATEAFADRYCHKCKMAQLSRSATVTEKPSRYLFVESVESHSPSYFLHGFFQVTTPRPSYSLSPSLFPDEGENSQEDKNLSVVFPQLPQLLPHLDARRHKRGHIPTPANLIFF